MKHIATITWILALVLSLAMPTNGACQSQADRIKEGKTLHTTILDRHKKIDKYYREPFIHGALTGNPLCCISVPDKEWRTLAESKKQALADYAASLVNKVKADPFKYSGTNKSGPLSARIYSNSLKMSGSSWCVFVGSITQDGRDILLDLMARSGK